MTESHVPETPAGPRPQDGLQLDPRETELRSTGDAQPSLREMKALTDGQAELTTQLMALSRDVRESLAGIGRELSQLRAELLSQRRGLALRSLFENLVGPWERLRGMSEALNRGAPSDEVAGSPDARLPGSPSPDALRNQLHAVVTILGRAIRELGFEEFAAAEGQEFDPRCMVCGGYAEGRPGVVLKAIKPGYRAGEMTVWPAQVLIADPLSKSTNKVTQGASP